jgi:hypothetical protein
MDTVHRLLFSSAIILPLLLGGITTLQAEEIRPDVPVVTAGFRFGVGGGHQGRSYRHSGQYRNWDNRNYYYYPNRGYYYNYYPYNYNYGYYNNYYPYYYNNGYNGYYYNSYPSNQYYYQYSW